MQVSEVGALKEILLLSKYISSNHHKQVELPARIVLLGYISKGFKTSLAIQQNHDTIIQPSKKWIVHATGKFNEKEA